MRWRLQPRPPASGPRRAQADSGAQLGCQLPWKPGGGKESGGGRSGLAAPTAFSRAPPISDARAETGPLSEPRSWGLLTKLSSLSESSPPKPR